MGEEQELNNGGNPDELSLDNNNNNNNNNNRVLDWEIGLPNSDELIPLTQSLISPQLASAFSIKLDQQSTDPIAFPGSQLPAPLSEDKEQPDVSSFPTTNSGGTSKRQRLVWTPKLHERFVEVVSRLGEKAVPKAIMQVMNVEGLTRENVASHLQKYRIYEKRMLGTPSDFVRVRENAIAVQEFQSPAAAFTAIPMPVFGFQQQQWFGNQAGMMGSHYAYGGSVERIEGWSGGSDSNRVPYDRRI